MHTAVIELDALPDAIRAAAENHDLVGARRIGLAFLFVRRIQVGGRRREFRRAGVHALESGSQICLLAVLTHDRLLDSKQDRDTAVREALALQHAQAIAPERLQALCAHHVFLLNEIFDLREEPWIDAGQFGDFRTPQADPEGIGDAQQPVRPGHTQFVPHLLEFVIGWLSGRYLDQPIDAGLEAAQRLLQRLLERAPDRHHLADRLHLRGQAVVRAGELLEGEARNLGDDIVDRRLERSRRCAAGDLVLQLVQRIADCEFCGDLGDREASCL